MSFFTLLIVLALAVVVVVIVWPREAAPGGTVARTCSQCGTAQPHHARFCKKCGRAL